MAENSKIEWTDHTFNPWIGCAKVSAGCKNCYAEELMAKRYGKVEWGVNGTRVRTSDDNWRKPIIWNKKAGREGIRYRVFCASLADVFEDREELIPWRNELFSIIESTPNLDWLLLTKRPENIMNFSPVDWDYAAHDNVWVGTSIENQAMADERMPELLRVPAKVRFLSMEPLLGSVDLSLWLHNTPEDEDGAPYPGGIDWVIVGGESGHHARPMHIDWVRSIRDQCVSYEVPFLFKQWGEYRLMVKLGKHDAGRLLDGVEWNQSPKG